LFVFFIDEVVTDDSLLSTRYDPIDLGWSDLRLVMKVKATAANNYRQEKVILDGSIRGRAVPGRMTAIMG
jgi:hypothetical protein